jgi:hypothetical protein
MKDLQEEDVIEIQQEIEVIVESDNDIPSTNNKA